MSRALIAKLSPKSTNGCALANAPALLPTRPHGELPIPRLALCSMAAPGPLPIPTTPTAPFKCTGPPSIAPLMTTKPRLFTTATSTGRVPGFQRPTDSRARRQRAGRPLLRVTLRRSFQWSMPSLFSSTWRFRPTATAFAHQLFSPSRCQCQLEFQIRLVPSL